MIIPHHGGRDGTRARDRTSTVLSGYLLWPLLLCASCTRVVGEVGRLHDDGAPASVDVSSSSDVSPGDDLSAPACSPQALVCDGFEQPLPGAWSAPNLYGGSLARIDASQGFVRTGDWALQLALPTDARMRYVDLSFQLAALTSGQLYLRAHLYLPADISSSEELVLLEVNCGNGATAKVSLGTVRGRAELVDLMDPEGYAESPTALPIGRWFCAELLVTIGGPGEGSMVATVDGVTEAAVGGINTTCGGFTGALLGLWSESQPSVEMYADDVVVATAPVGCN